VAWTKSNFRSPGAIGAIGIVATALVLAGCSSSSPSAASTSTAPTAKPVDYYVSLGDSYAAGYQPTGPHSGHTDTNGFAYQVTRLASAIGYDFKLVNFGCSGATTTSILYSVGCAQAFLGPHAAPYPDLTQAGAAEAFLRANKGKVGLITVSISGNDVTHCASVAQVVPCLSAALATVKKNMKTFLTALRAAAGPGVPIIGTTYPDVILGLYVSKTASDVNLAGLSVTAFKDLINPALKAAYTAIGASFVDVTAATGAYGPMSSKTDLPPYGEIPTPVAKVCELTFYCEYRNIHPRTAGYTIIANLIVGALPQH
jgi:lysophospholipase L1-like esterase